MPPFAPASFTIVVDFTLSEQSAGSIRANKLGDAVNDAVRGSIPADERAETSVVITLDERKKLRFGVPDVDAFDAATYELTIRRNACKGTLHCIVFIELGRRRGRALSGQGSVTATIERRYEHVANATNTSATEINGTEVASSLEAETGAAATVEEEEQLSLNAEATLERIAPTDESGIDESLSQVSLSDQVSAGIGLQASEPCAQDLLVPPQAHDSDGIDAPKGLRAAQQAVDLLEALEKSEKTVGHECAPLRTKTKWFDRMSRSRFRLPGSGGSWGAPGSGASVSSDAVRHHEARSQVRQSCRARGARPAFRIMCIVPRYFKEFAVA